MTLIKMLVKLVNKVFILNRISLIVPLILQAQFPVQFMMKMRFVFFANLLITCLMVNVSSFPLRTKLKTVMLMMPLKSVCSVRTHISLKIQYVLQKTSQIVQSMKVLLLAVFANQVSEFKYQLVNHFVFPYPLSPTALNIHLNLPLTALNVRKTTISILQIMFVQQLLVINSLRTALNTTPIKPVKLAIPNMCSHWITQNAIF